MARLQYGLKLKREKKKERWYLYIYFVHKLITNIKSKRLNVCLKKLKFMVLNSGCIECISVSIYVKRFICIVLYCIVWWY